MARWRDWLRCIGQAVMAKGLRALLEQVPFGALVFDVAADALARINREQPAETRRQRRRPRRFLVCGTSSGWPRSCAIWSRSSAARSNSMFAAAASIWP